MRCVVVFLLVALTLPSALAETRDSELFQKGATGIEPCAACHAADGTGNPQQRVPAIAGQPAGYLAKQLADFRTGLRASQIMEPIARRLDVSQTRDVTAFMATLRSPAPTASESPELGQHLAKIGKWEIGVPPCDKCHGTDGRGIAPHFPALSGQIANYIIDSLLAYRNDARNNDPQGMMRHVAKGLSDAETSAVAQYYQAERRKP